MKPTGATDLHRLPKIIKISEHSKGAGRCGRAVFSRQQPGKCQEFAFGIALNMVWTPYSFIFTAGGTEETLFFRSLDDDATNPGWGPVIDLVSVNAVPISAAAWLLGTGLMGLAAIRRKHR